MRFVCNIMKGAACLARASVDNLEDESSEETGDRASLALMRDAMRSGTLDDSEHRNIELISFEYARLVREAMYTGKSSDWTVLAEDGRIDVLPAHYATLTKANVVSGHISLHDDTWIADTEAFLDSITKAETPAV